MEKEFKDGIKKWDINSILDKDSNKVPNDNGYFGGYTIIKFNGKSNIVYCDDRNAECVLDELRKKPHKSSVCGMNCVFFRILFVYF